MSHLDLLQEIRTRKFNNFNRRMITPETCILLNKLLAIEPDDRMSWHDLFNYEHFRAKKEKDKQYMLYEEFMNNINLKNMHALPGIFCLANPNWREFNESKSSIRHLDT